MQGGKAYKEVSFNIQSNDVKESVNKVIELLGKENIELKNIKCGKSSSIIESEKSIPVINVIIEFETSAAEHSEKIVKEIGKFAAGTVVSKSKISVPWFPTKGADLDKIKDHVFSYGEELDADHPGFTDQIYRERRSKIVQIAKDYIYGQEIPIVEYTEDETRTWKECYTQLKQLYPSHACTEHAQNLPLFENELGFGPDKIPQLRDVSKFLKQRTGWRLKPVMGLLTVRDFLNAFAFKVFHSTQYIRHQSRPIYTPEPDVCHEVLGHIPLLADPDFSLFSHEIGLASLGCSDEDLEKLGTLYWWTVEFGLCKSKDGIRAYGAGLLSSFGELKYSLSDEPKLVDLDCNKAAETKYVVTEYQPSYFVADSFAKVRTQFLQFASSLNKPFKTRLNEQTETIEVLDLDGKVLNMNQQTHFSSDKLDIELGAF